MFVSGAIGMKLFEARLNEQGGYQNLDYTLLVTIEETLELLGVLLSYMQKSLGSFKVELKKYD